MSDELLRAEGLAFSYGERPVLRGVGFRVGCGEFVALVGPNGSGKSTLIRLITKVLTPSTGSLFLRGEPMAGMKPDHLARQIAVVPQESSIDFGFTAFEMTLMGRTPHLGPLARESPRDLDVAARSMEMTDTSHLADRTIQQLSGGERQRVVVARALAQEPQLLLLDEPTSHLDINHQADLLSLVLDLCRDRKMGALAVLHDLNLAAAFADRVLMLHEGRIDVDGTPSEVLTAKRIQRVFQARTSIIVHPHTGRPVILLEPGSRGAGRSLDAKRGASTQSVDAPRIQ